MEKVGHFLYRFPASVPGVNMLLSIRKKYKQ